MMSRGLGKIQRKILESLNEKEGRVTTNVLMEDMQIGNRSGKVSFWRGLVGLEKKGLILWDRGAGASPGFVYVKRTNIWLLDIDSTLGNIALMKISQFHKQQGHNVYLQQGLEIKNTIDKPDIVYISCIFTWNRSEARKLARQFQSQGIEVHIGGSGISLSKALPPEIEKMRPDYTIYPQFNYNLMHLSRGCPRSCKFCSVPKMKYEGKPHPVGDLYDFWDGRANEIQILDNNILAVPSHFKKVARQIIIERLRVKFHALDIRFVDDEIAILLKQMHISDPKFSFDDIRDKDTVLRGIEILRRNGIKRSAFYVLAGFESDFEDALYRVELLKDLGQIVFVMIYDKENQKDRRFFYLRDYCNAHHVYGSTKFEEYVKGRHD